MITALIALLIGPEPLPKDLKPFDLSGSYIAREFRVCSVGLGGNQRGDFREVQIYMRSGPSELDCSVKVFDSKAELKLWESETGRTTPAWNSPFKSVPGRGAERGSLGGKAAAYDRFLISVCPSQRGENSRKRLGEDKFRLSDESLNRLAAQAMKELILRARHYARGT